jgi:hypothetical protein
MLAGVLLVLGGGLVAFGSRQDWLALNVPQGGTATLDVVGSRFGTGMLVFAAVIVALGVARIARGYAEDRSLHRVATIAALAAIAMALARTGLFLVDHNLSLGAAGSYSHLDVKSGIYMLAGGAVVTAVSRFA